MEFAVHDIDFAVIALYLAVVLVIGLITARRTRSADDLFLAGRRLGWVAIGFSLFASNISTTTMIGLAGAAYTWGIAVANYEWMAALVLIAFAVLLIPLYLRARITTVPEFLELRFDRRSRVYFSALTLFANIVIDAAGGLFAGAIVVRTFFPEVEIATACLAIAAFAGLYTAAGGLAAVVYTDVLQAVVLLAGSALVTWFTFEQIEFSWFAVVAALGDEHLSLMRPLDDPFLPWLGTVVGVPILGFYFWCTNQFITQRVLAARGIQQARWGALLAGLLKLPVLFIMVIPGAAAVLVLPDLPRGDMVFPALVKTVLPVGAVGLVLAALMAAIMSSIDSTLNSAATLVTVDFVKPRFPGLGDRRTAQIGRVAIVVFMLFAAAVAPLIEDFEGLFQYLQTALAFLVPPVAVLFSLGVLWQRGTATGAFASLLASHTVSAVLFFLTVTDAISVHFTIIAGILFAVGCLAFVAASLVTAPPSERQRSFCFSRAQTADAPGVPFYQGYRFLAGVLFVLTAGLVAAFW